MGFKQSNCVVFHTLLYMVAITLLIFSCSQVYAEADAPVKKVKLESRLAGTDISKFSYYYEDDENILGIREIVKTKDFRDYGKPTISLGYSKSSFWLKLTLINESSHDRELVLALDYPLIDDVRFYEPSESGYSETRSGDLIPFVDRKIHYRNFAFDTVVFANSEKTVFLRIKTTSSLTFGIHVWDRDTFSEFMYKDFGFNCLVYGLILGLLCYNVVIFLSLRSKSYLYYSCWILFQGLAIFSWSGLGKELVWGNSHWLTQLAWPISSCLSANAAILFQLHFFRLNERLPLIAKLYAIIVVFFVVIGLSYLVVDVSLVHRFAITMSLITCLMLVAVAIFLSYKGNRQAYFFLIAWSFILLTISAAILNVVSNGSISYSNLIYAAELASAFEGIALSIALADRIKETNLAVAKSVKKELHVADQLRKIVYPHQIDMISRGIELESTMPTGVGEACVISLDIVGSSKIQHIYAKEFFRKVFSRCNEVMMEGYSKDDMRASAYRVKEMGDGFLCSVGYPFKSANPSIAHGAIELAYKFEQIFREEVDQLEYPERINCGIGISYDSLFGFYPQAGAKEYDLYGRAIVLATRYESMRKVILKSSDKVNLLIIQERVYKSLTKNLREKFIAFDLKKENFEVRDDPSAEVLYYAILSGAEESNVSAYPEISDLAS